MPDRGPHHGPQPGCGQGLRRFRTVRGRPVVAQIGRFRGGLRRARTPAAIGLLAGLGLLLFVLPLAGLILRAPWSQALAELTDPTTTMALGLSIFCSLTATAIALVLGIPLAMILARTRGTVRNVLRALTTLPMLLRPAIFSGAVLCWARALGEFGATITFAGNFPGRTQTVPIAVYLALETKPEAAITLSLILLVVSVAILVGMRDRWLGAL